MALSPKKPGTIKVPLQSTTKNGKNIFVYIRRSTTHKQELSIQKQDDSSRETIENNGFNESEVEYYIESITAYGKLKTSGGMVTDRRPEFDRMIRAIDISSEPVTILTYEPSRLSRNDYDSQYIVDRLFNQYHDKKIGKIQRIIFNNGEEWTEKTEKGIVKTLLLESFKESEKISRRVQGGNQKQLERGVYIIRTPRGIDRLKHGETVLKTNKEIPHIVQAFEMKARGASNREIKEFLGEHDITVNTGLHKMFEPIIYAGYWMNPQTGELVEQKFAGGKPPISLELYQKVQDTLSKNTGKTQHSFKYGSKQDGGAIAQLLKWEEDRQKKFSVELAKGKYRSYKSNAFGGFNKSEKKILQAFCEGPLLRIIQIYSKLLSDIIQGAYESKFHDILEDVWDNGIAEEELYKKKYGPIPKKKLTIEEEIQYNNYRGMLSRLVLKQSFYLKGLDPDQVDKLSDEQVKEMNKQNLISRAKKEELYVLKFSPQSQYFDTEMQRIREELSRIKCAHKYENYALDMLDQTITELIGESEQEAKNAIKSMLIKYRYPHYENEQRKKVVSIEKLKGEIERCLKDIKTIQMNGLTNGYPLELVNEAVESKNIEIKTIEDKIQTLSQAGEIEHFIDALPDILAKTFELSKKAIMDQEFEQSREDIMKLIEITTFELTVDTKKELRIKLFDWLEDFQNVDFQGWLGM